MSDSFYSDEDSPTHKGAPSGPLMPIVEVSSEVSSRTTSARSERSNKSSNRSGNSEDDTPRTERSEQDENSDEGTAENEEDESPGSSRASSRRRKYKKRKAKNGKHPIDMTPPDRLLKKAERKSKRYTREKKADKAIKELIRCTALARIEYGDGHWKLGKSYVNLAQGYLDLKGYTIQAQYHSEHAKNLMMANTQMSSSSTEKAGILETLLNMYYILGRAYSAQKKYSDAEQIFMKAEKIASERAKLTSVTDDEIDDWDIKLYIAMAKLNGKQLKPAVAIECFEKALDLLQVKFGDDSVELIPVYQGMGIVEQSKGRHADHEKAIEYYLQAHSISSKHYKGGSIELADTARGLATAYSNIGEDDAETSAESYLNECLAIYLSVHGPNHVKTLEVQDELSRLMIRTDRPEEAVSLLRSTINAKTEIHGEFSAEVADTYKLIGSIHLSKGDSEKALRALKKCHNIECLKYGTNNRKSKDTQRTIDIIMANPNIAAKQKKSKADELKERPRFNSIVSRNTQIGGFKA